MTQSAGLQSSRANPAGGPEPQPPLPPTAAAPPLSPHRVRSKRKGVDHHALSEPMRKGLRTLLIETRVIHETQVWRGLRGGEIRRETIEALYDRLLVKVVLEDRQRRRHYAELTEIGTLVAERLLLADPVHHISEPAALLISAMVDGFEDATTVYAEPAE